MTLTLILLIIFTLSSCFFSLSQMSLFSLSSSTVKLFKESKEPRKQLTARLLSRPRDLLVTLLFCDIASNLFVQNAAANLFGEFTGWGLKVGVPLVVTLLVGEIFPKTIALPNNRAISYRLAPIIFRVRRILGPLRIALTWITTHISRFLFFFLRREKEISQEELHLALKTSESYGILTPDETELVDGYLRLSDTTVRERMHPREEIIFYDINEPLTKLLHLFTHEEVTRIPVCRDDLQNMLGILSADTLFLHRHKINTVEELIPYLKKPTYVPETISTRSLLRTFLTQHEHMGIVVDEYGSISGLVSEEDLFEVVVGEITDRRDEKSRYTQAGKNEVITSGKFELSEFEELFDVALPSQSHMVTVGGWLTEQLGDIPKSGTKYEWNGFLFHVLAADPKRVRRIYIRRLNHD